ncbi:MAG: hypothetical protein FWH17_10020 [Oscillospiraceae bacterium]|nr:hypothetical protein [Oscillospiraceae bacterium]
MKRSDLFIRLMTGVIFLAVIVYGGFMLYDLAANPYETIYATQLTVEEAFPARGYIVRTETVLPDFYITALPGVVEGEKVAAGVAVGTEYFSSEALEIASEIRALTMKIAQLEAGRGKNDDAGRGAVMELSVAAHSGNFRRLDELALNIETGIFAAQADIEQLKSRLEEMSAKTINTRSIYAPVSGYFSGVVDGFEHISPNVIRDMTPSVLQAHFNSPVMFTGAGKLVTDPKWYYVAVMNYEEAIRLREGQTKTVQFSGAFQADVDMLVESIGKAEDNACVVVFSSKEGIHNVTALRLMRANVVSDVYTGIRVPKQAVRLDENDTEYIYLQTSGYAERVDIERLPAGRPIEIGDSYLVRDGLETGSPLRTGAVIIVRASNLYHGKVVG